MEEGIIILSDYHEWPTFLCMQTIRKHCIKNAQYSIITEQDMIWCSGIEKKYDAKFQGSPSAKYNCHGLTFASKRTGIHDDDEIFKILEDEYKEIKDINEVLVGDVVVYFADNKPDHSGIVVDINKDGIIPLIKVLSKSRKCSEIVHNANITPYSNDKKYYRINHDEFRIVK